MVDTRCEPLSLLLRARGMGKLEGSRYAHRIGTGVLMQLTGDKAPVPDTPHVCIEDSLNGEMGQAMFKTSHSRTHSYRRVETFLKKVLNGSPPKIASHAFYKRRYQG